MPGLDTLVGKVCKFKETAKSIKKTGTILGTEKDRGVLVAVIQKNDGKLCSVPISWVWILHQERQNA